MSTFTLPVEQTDVILRLSEGRLRPPTDNIGVPAAVERTLVYEPDLTPAEQAIFDRLLRLARAAVALSPEEWATLLPILVRGRDYVLNPSPTGAETVQSVKDLWRVLRALLRD